MYNEITVAVSGENIVVTGYWVYSISQGVLTLVRFDPETHRPAEIRVVNRNAWSAVEMKILGNAASESPVEFEGITLRMN